MDFETRGVLLHELTHAYQLEPQGIGSYGTNKVFWAFIEGMADAVRIANGGFHGENDRPKGGNYMDGYRCAGYFSFGCVIIKILIFSVNSTGVRLRSFLGRSMVLSSMCWVRNMM